MAAVSRGGEDEEDKKEEAKEEEEGNRASHGGWDIAGIFVKKKKRYL